MNPAQLVDAIRHALAAAVDAGDLVVDVPADIPLDRPRSREHGDYATPIALKLAKVAGPAAPGDRRGDQPGTWPDTAGIAGVEIAGPGFLNITLETAAAGRAGRRRSSPPGPLTAPGTRWPASGSTWSSSRPTPPGRCTSAARGGRRSATRWAGC